jgi:hypothetical protein
LCMNCPATKKKPYAPPVLTKFGTVAEITKTVGIRGGFDNGLHVTRTSLS